MKLFNRLRGDESKISHLVARLGDRIACPAHLADQLLSRFGVFGQSFGSLCKDLQDLADTPLLLSLDIRKLAYAVAACPQVTDNRFQLATDRLILLPFRTVNDRLQARDEFVDFLSQVVGLCRPKQEIHIIVDILSSHNTQKVTECLEAHPEVMPHFTPMYS